MPERCWLFRHNRDIFGRYGASSLPLRLQSPVGSHAAAWVTRDPSQLMAPADLRIRWCRLGPGPPWVWGWWPLGITPQARACILREDGPSARGSRHPRAMGRVQWSLLWPRLLRSRVRGQSLQVSNNLLQSLLLKVTRVLGRGPSWCKGTVSPLWAPHARTFPRPWGAGRRGFAEVCICTEKGYRRSPRMQTVFS